MHEVSQGEGDEQGDALMTGLFSLGLHEALVQARSQLQADENLVGYLDDLYVVTDKHRARQAYDTVMGCIRIEVGIEANLGKTESWGINGGEPQRGINDLGMPDAPPIWKGNLVPHLNRIEILGTPLGSQAYIPSVCHDKITGELKLSHRLNNGLSHQAAWLILNYCAAPRANYLLHNLTPSNVSAYTSAYDATIRETFVRIFTRNPKPEI